MARAAQRLGEGLALAPGGQGLGRGTLVKDDAQLAGLQAADFLLALAPVKHLDWTAVGHDFEIRDGFQRRVVVVEQYVTSLQAVLGGVAIGQDHLYEHAVGGRWGGFDGWQRKDRITQGQ